MFMYMIHCHQISLSLPHLDGLHEGEEQRPDADRAPEELDESGGAEEAEKADVDDARGVHDAPHHRDEVEGVPRVLEVRLQGKVSDVNNRLRQQGKKRAREDSRLPQQTV